MIFIVSGPQGFWLLYTIEVCIYIHICIYLRQIYTQFINKKCDTVMTSIYLPTFILKEYIFYK